MKKSTLLIAGLIVAAIVLGAASAYADGVFSLFWQQQSDFIVSLGIVAAGLIGNAAGVWALGALIASYIIVRERSKVVAGIGAGIMFLFIAVVSYYATIKIGALRPDAALLSTMLRWLVVSVVVGSISGLAGGWLATTQSSWRKVMALALVLGYVGFDCVLALRNSGLMPAVMVVLIVYFMMGLWLMWVMARSVRLIVLAVAVGALGCGLLILFLPFINAAFIQLQHGDVPQDTTTVIQVN